MHEQIPSSCQGCPFSDLKNPLPLVKGTGPANAQVMVVSARPGKEEVRALKPFAGPNGKVVRGAVESLVGDRVWYTHLVKRPVDKVTVSNLGGCVAHLAEEIRTVKPKVIIALGAEPAAFFLKKRYKLDHVRGMLIPVSMYRHSFKLLVAHDVGYVCRTGGLSGKRGDDWLADLAIINTCRGLD